MKNIHFSFLLVLSFFMITCKKDKPPTKYDNTTIYPNPVGKRIIVSNEGLFNSGNGDVSVIDLNTLVTYNDVFKLQNGNSPGDILQSITFFNEKAYLILNNSGKIEICNQNDFKSTGSISGFNSPRYMHVINSTKAYVTDLYANGIYIVNLSSASISGFINLSGWTEQLFELGDEIWVSNFTHGKIYCINKNSDQITDSISLSKGSHSLVKDKNNSLWILAGGDEVSSTAAKLYQVNPATKSIIQSFTFPASQPYASNLTLSPNGDELYYINKDVMNMKITATALPSTASVKANGKNFYALTLDNEYLYVNDAKDYTQQGFLYRYQLNTKTVVDSFKVGLIPGHIYIGK